MINMFPEDNEASLTDEYRELQLKYNELEEKYRELSERYTALQQEFEEVKNSKSKAGRKPNDEKWTAKYQAFARMKAEGCRREQIQQELNMSRATYFRYNKIYSSGGNVADLHKELAREMPQVVEIPAAKTIPLEGLVLDPESGDYVTPEGLKRRKKLAEIRARRAAEEELKRQKAESEAEQAAAQESAEESNQEPAREEAQNME